MQHHILWLWALSSTIAVKDDAEGLFYLDAFVCSVIYNFNFGISFYLIYYSERGGKNS